MKRFGNTARAFSDSMPFLALFLAVTMAALVAPGTALSAEGPYAKNNPILSSKDANQQASDMKRVVVGHSGGYVTQKTDGMLKNIGSLKALVNEEGRGYKVPRSGHEVAFYKKIKQFIATRKPGQKIDRSHMLQLGMDVCRQENGDVNLPDVYLTIHNVTRLLSRPEMWSDETSMKQMAKDADVYPICQDVLGQKSVDDNPALVDLCGVKRASSDGKTIKKGDVIDKRYSLETLFNLGGDGVFEPLPGALEYQGNGGAYYYFWLGSLSKSLGGQGAIWGGDWYEWAQKKGGLEYIPVWWSANPDEFARGKFQLSYFRGGGIFADKAKWTSGQKNLAAKGYLLWKRKYQSWYCTNRPHIWAPLPLTDKMKRKDLPRAEQDEMKQQAERLLEKWRKDGKDTQGLDSFHKSLFERIDRIEGRADMKQEAIAWWLQTLAAGDSHRLKSSLESWVKTYGKFDPAMKSSAEHAIQSLGEGNAP